MDNWPKEEGCGAHEDFLDVERVCRHLDIPYYRVDFSRQYREEVFSPFLEDYRRGLTPNPDVACNREIKFKLFFRKALALGAHYMATGHYARREYRDGGLKLLRGIDANKDQTYFLHALKEFHLERVLFPLGHLTKPKVRALAKKWGLATAEKKDSTGICFIGKRNFREFLSRYIPPSEGPLVGLDGRLVGHHRGQAYYTLGQRRGLGLGGPGAPGLWWARIRPPTGSLWNEGKIIRPSLPTDFGPTTWSGWVLAPRYPCAVRPRPATAKHPRTAALKFLAEESRWSLTLPNGP